MRLQLIVIHWKLCLTTVTWLGGSLGQNTTFKYLSSAATVTSQSDLSHSPIQILITSNGSQTVNWTSDSAKDRILLEGVTKEFRWKPLSVNLVKKDTGYHVTAAVSRKYNSSHLSMKNGVQLLLSLSSGSRDQVASECGCKWCMKTSTNSTSTSEERQQRQTTHQKSVSASYAEHFLKRWCRLVVR